MSNAVTGLGAQFLIGPPVGSSGPFTLIGELANFNPNGREWDVLDVTNFDSKYDKEKIKGLRNPGQFWLTGNRIDGDAGQNLLKTAFDDPRAYMMQIWVPASRGFSGGIWLNSIQYGEVWSFAGLVLSIDPPVIAPGKALRFFSKIQATWKRHISTSWVNATGHCEVTISGSLGTIDWGVVWGGFSTPALPSDAVIQGIYPVFAGSAHSDRATSSYTYGTGLVPTHWGPPVINLPTDPANTSFTNSEFYGPSIGTSLSALAGQEIMVALHSSLVIMPLTDTIDITGVGFAVYYTSATPVTDPQMPPPFAVPAGQGLAWSLPFQVVTQTGSTSEGTGILRGGTGVGVGTAVTLN